MEVSLYVYDLSRGMARQMSQSFLGIQIDAVYHTSIVFNNTEYFYGAGIQMCRAGMSHHGRPMEVIKLGQTSLPPDVIEDYLGSLSAVYSPESYDLFAHNCNNFSHDFSQFLVGKGIPDRITNLPKQVLDTPFGQMLRPQIDASMRSVTQAAVPAHANSNNPPSSRSTPINQQTTQSSRDIEASKLEISREENIPRAPSSADFAPWGIQFKTHTATSDPSIISTCREFVRQRHSKPIQDVPLPDLAALREYLLQAPNELSGFHLDATYDLFDSMLTDQRVSTFFAEEGAENSTVAAIVAHANKMSFENSPLGLAVLRMSCSFLSSPAALKHLPDSQSLLEGLVQLSTRNILNVKDSWSPEFALVLAFNMCTVQFNASQQGGLADLSLDNNNKSLKEDVVIELAVALIEALSSRAFERLAIGGKDQSNFTKTAIVSLGRLAYKAPPNGELLTTCEALEAVRVVEETKNILGNQYTSLVDEVVRLLKGDP